jgi:hypothetical protein
MHPAYVRLTEKARRGHQQGRSPAGIAPEDIDLGRLYSYLYRRHTIGAFHATRLALEQRPAADALSRAHRARACELLEDLANQGMDPVPADFQVVLSTFYRYDGNVRRVIDSLRQDYQASRDPAIAAAAERFTEIVREIATSNGLLPARDTEAPPQASFVVPNLGITIVPLVYGDHHSWNLAHLSADHPDVPRHRHHHGAEIHLGYSPLRGITILGDSGAEVTEGYAMPIPPLTDHGYANVGPGVHHVPFIFGSLHEGGWGVFLDVEARPYRLEEIRRVPLQGRAMNHSVYLERELREAEARPFARRWTLLPAAATDRSGSGGLELSIARVTEYGLSLPAEGYRIVSVVRGTGTVRVNGVEQALGPHDHVGIPAGMKADLKQSGAAPLVVLDVVIVETGARPATRG